MKRWLARPAPLEAAGESDRHEGGPLPAPLVTLLRRRGVGPGQFESFLSPSLERLSDWRSIPGMEKAALEVCRAVRSGTPILVWGDYDADGLTAAASAALTIMRHGGRVQVHIPDRLGEGYGLGPSGVRTCLDSGAGLLLTVDCGVASPVEIAEIERSGVRVVVTDHHEPAGPVPQATALVDPRLHPGEAQAWSGLSGAGLSYLLCRAVEQMMGEDDPPGTALALAAVGTICDVVPLTGDNRIIAHCGLAAARAGASPGISAIASSAGLDPSAMISSDISFRIGPRLNACGRVGSPMEALAVLMSESPGLISSGCARIEELNWRRRSLDQQVCDEAFRMAGECSGRHTVFLASTGWHRGVVGIAASRLASELGKPVVLASIGSDGIARGSARSIPGLAINEVLAGLSHLLIESGGHKAAAGLTIRADRLDEFRSSFESAVADSLPGGSPGPALYLDGRLAAREIDIELAESISRLEPFGEANEEPVWITSGVRLTDCRRVGDGKHLSCSLDLGGRRLGAVGFGMGDRQVPQGDLEAAYCLRVESFRGNRDLRLHLKDFRPARTPAP